MRRALASVAVLTTVAFASWGSAAGAFSAASAQGGSRWTTDSLDAVGSFSAARPCAAMAPTFVAAASGTTGSTTLTIARPSGAVAGDVLVAVVVSSDNSDRPTTPSGWTLLRQAVGSTTASAMFARVLAAGDAATTSFSFGGFDTSDTGVGVIAAYRGALAPAPWEAHDVASGSSTTLTAPTVTALTAPTRLVTAYGVQSFTSSISAPAGTQLRSTTSSLDRVALFDRALTAPGASGTTTSTVSPAAYHHGYTVALTADPTVKDPSVTLTWTEAPDTYADGYALDRTGTSPAAWLITPRATVTYTDVSLPASSAASYDLAAAAGSWRSTSMTATVAAC